MRRLIASIRQRGESLGRRFADWLGILLLEVYHHDDPHAPRVLNEPAPLPRWIVWCNWTLVCIVALLLLVTVGAQVWHVVSRNINS